MKKFAILSLSMLMVAAAWAATPKRSAPATGWNTTSLSAQNDIFQAGRQGGDTVDDATVIDALPFNDTGTTMGFNDDYDEVCPYEGSTAPDVVYSYTPAVDEDIDITLCNGSEYDTKLYLYENEVTPGAPFACNDDECPGYVSELLGLSITGGNTYFIVIDGYDTEAGNYVLDITALGGGDSCDDPFNCVELPYQYIGTTADNTDTYGNAGPDEWHAFTLDEASIVIIDLCNETTDYDTYIHLLTDDCVTVVAANDDGAECPESPAPYPPSQLEVDLEPGSYVLCVEGYDVEAGNYGVDIYVWEPPLYGTCQFPPHTPDEDWSAGTSHNNGDDIDYLRADRFGEAAEPIVGVAVMGLSLFNDGAWHDCVEDPMDFTVSFYEDGDLPGDLVCTHQYDATPVATGDIYAEFPLYEIYFPLPEPIELFGGWFSVQSYSECWFLWMSTPDVDGISAISEAGGTWASYDYDLAWCLAVGEAVTEQTTPHQVTLHASYPNPFNPVTTISYELATPRQVELEVFNIGGEIVATLVDGAQTAGLHSLQFNGSSLPSGIYFARLTAGEFVQTQRMLLVK